MVGSPYQELGHIAEDLSFLQTLQPQMVGIGPFIPHNDTPMREFPPGDLGLTLFIISLVRIILPCALIPAATAMGVIDKRGREAAVRHGANVLMTNISPSDRRDKYALYDGKHAAGDHAAEHEVLKARFEKMGYEFIVGRGDYDER
jgi:biotin synthase